MTDVTVFVSCRRTWCIGWFCGIFTPIWTAPPTYHLWLTHTHAVTGFCTTLHIFYASIERLCCICLPAWYNSWRAPTAHQQSLPPHVGWLPSPVTSGSISGPVTATRRRLLPFTRAAHCCTLHLHAHHCAKQRCAALLRAAPAHIRPRTYPLLLFCAAACRLPGSPARTACCCAPRAIVLQYKRTRVTTRAASGTRAAGALVCA